MIFPMAISYTEKEYICTAVAPIERIIAGQRIHLVVSTIRLDMTAII